MTEHSSPPKPRPGPLQGIRVLDAACDGCELDWTHLPWGSDHHERTGALMDRHPLYPQLSPTTV